MLLKRFEMKLKSIENMCCKIQIARLAVLVGNKNVSKNAYIDKLQRMFQIFCFSGFLDAYATIAWPLFRCYRILEIL